MKEHRLSLDILVHLTTTDLLLLYLHLLECLFQYIGATAAKSSGQGNIVSYILSNEVVANKALLDGEKVSNLKLRL